MLARLFALLLAFTVMCTPFAVGAVPVGNLPGEVTQAQSAPAHLSAALADLPDEAGTVDLEASAPAQLPSPEPLDEFVADHLVDLEAVPSGPVPARHAGLRAARPHPRITLAPLALYLDALQRPPSALAATA